MPSESTSLSILVAFILEGFVILYNLYGNEPKDRLLDRMEQLKLNIMYAYRQSHCWLTKLLSNRSRPL